MHMTAETAQKLYEMISQGTNSTDPKIMEAASGLLEAIGNVRETGDDYEIALLITAGDSPQDEGVEEEADDEDDDASAERT